MKSKIISGFGILLLLTGCSANSSTYSQSEDIDFNMDIEVIGKGVQRFEANSKNAIDISNAGGEDFSEIIIENQAALDEVDSATDVFLSHINQASSKLPSEDTDESPSKAKLLAWANGYKSWVMYQRLGQAIGEKCLNSNLKFSDCLLMNLSDTMEYERLSRVDLNNAVAGIQEWRRSLGYK